ncbi:MAG: sulfatase [Myxococcales bacterium]|nr:sulfatase [Myxococcales bacterium]
MSDRDSSDSGSTEAEPVSSRRSSSSSTSTSTASAPHRTLGQRWRRTGELRRRVSLAVGVSVVAGVFATLLDSAWAMRGGEGRRFVELALGVGGALGPLALVLGLAVGVSSWLVHPRVEPSVVRLLDRLRDLAPSRTADIAAFVPLATLGLFAWATLSAHLARTLLGAAVPASVCGAVLAVASLGLGATLALVVLALTPALRKRLATWRSRWRGAVDPVATLALALAVVTLLLAYGIQSGTVSGDGGLLGIFGVFKREELDLRAPALLLAWTLAIYLAPPMFSWLRSYQAWALAAVALSVTMIAARRLDASPDTARALERSAPVAKVPLRLLARLGDRDKDGASGWFGGGDCDDNNAAIGPAADDVPNNGVDEDCSGSDLHLEPTAALGPELPVSAEGEARLPKAGNAILITVDTLRYDLGFAGYERAVSPNLDRLAKRSAVFERAYALASYTGKSVGPMLIGKYGSETHRNWGHFNKFSSEDTFVAERLKRAGFRTMSVQGHRYFGAFGGLERGFDDLDLSAAPPEGAAWATDTTTTSDKLTDAAIALLDRHGSGQFFLWIHYLDPHANYVSHAGTPEFGKSARDRYDHEVRYTDQEIGRLLSHVEKAAWAGRTSIVVTSDHGEAFGEHGMHFHGFELWEPLVRVPLIVHVPGLDAKRVATPRGAIDLVPTLLDLCRVPRPPSVTEAPADSHDFVSGASLIPDLLASPGAILQERDVVVDMPAGPYNEARRALIHGDLKLIVSRDAQKELFDLRRDPGETKNVWAERKREIEAPYARAKSRMRLLEVTGPRK